MGKIKKIFGFGMPVLITCLVLMTFHKKDTIETNPILAQEKSNSDRELLDNWMDSKKSVLENSFFDKVKIKKDNQIFKLSDLDSKKIETFKLSVFAKTRRDCQNALMNKEKIDNDQYNKILNLKIELDKKIQEQKKIIYNTYGSFLHPLDKEFLDKFDDYFYK